MQINYSAALLVASIMSSSAWAANSGPDAGFFESFERVANVEEAGIPFAKDAAVYRATLYDIASLEDLIGSSLIGSTHDLKVTFFSEHTKVEVPGHRIRYDTILGYDPERDEERPYSKVFDPNVKYKLEQGKFKVWGSGFENCGDASAIFSSGSSIYVQMENTTVEGASASCAVNTLLKAYDLFGFHERDRPEMYEVKKLNEEEQPKIIRDIKINEQW